MFIHEAINARSRRAPYISRIAWSTARDSISPFAPATDSNFFPAVWIQPTNSPDCCIIYSEINKVPRRGWQPSAEDLSANDWFVTAGADQYEYARDILASL